MFEKPLYIAKRLSVLENDYGVEIETFDVPNPYKFLYMPTSSSVDYQIYGTNVNNMFTAYISIKYLGQFHEGDRAYLIDEDLQDVSIAIGDTNCAKANYKVVYARPQNTKIKITFEKIKQTK